MKKILSLAVALFAVATSFAQTSVSIVPRAGVSLATMTNTQNGKIIPGFVGGADVQFQFNDIVGLTAGVFYEMQGCKGSYDSGIATVTQKYKNDYVNIPILFNCYVVKGLAVKLGLQPGFLVSSKLTTTAAGVSDTGNSKEIFNTVDLSIPVGLSYEISNVVLDVRYNWGLTNILKNKIGDLEFDDRKSRNSVFQITLGYRFQL